MTTVAYIEYLASPSWKLKSLEAKERAGWRCQACGREDLPLEVHHNSHRRLGCEREQDLIVLCEECHELFWERMPRLPIPRAYTAM